MLRFMLMLTIYSIVGQASSKKGSQRTSWKPSGERNGFAFLSAAQWASPDEILPSNDIGRWHL